MSQHDQNIANDTGAAVRGDINNALAALFGLSSGATSPSTTIAYMLWADTTNGLLKQRNAANADWLVRGTLAETFLVARSSNTILGVADHSRVFIATSTFTQTLTAAATLGDGWWCGYRNDGSGVITIDPNSTEQIDGGNTITLQPGESCFIFCNGSAFKTVGRRRINDLTEDTAPVAADDYVETWDASATGHKKVKLDKLGFPVSGTKTATTSGTSVDFASSIPAATTRITVTFEGVSTNGTSGIILQLGDSGGVETSGYSGSGGSVNNAAATNASTHSGGFRIGGSNADASSIHGALTLTLHDEASNTWVASGTLAKSNSASVDVVGGYKALSGTLDRLRLTTIGGTDVFDGGSINYVYE